MDHAKLANFEHAILHPFSINGTGQRISGVKLLEEEIIRLAAWLAPEVVLFSQSAAKSEITTTGRSDSAYLSNFSGTDTSEPTTDNKSTPSPASDVFGIARVMQEMLEPKCAHRFNRSVPSLWKTGKSSSKYMENGIVTSHIRPAIKRALSRDPTARGMVEDLHTTVVQTFWALQQQTAELQFQGLRDVSCWCEILPVRPNSTSSTSCALNSPTEYSSTGSTIVQIEEHNSENDNKENQFENLDSYSATTKHDYPRINRVNREQTQRPDCSSRRPLKEIRFNVASDFYAKDTEEAVNEWPKPLTFSSPNREHQSNGRVRKSGKNLTKEQYIEMVAIPCEPLGPGRSRPQVPWRELSAPARLTSTSSSSSSSNHESAATSSSSIDYKHDVHKKKSNKAPIKPASHLTTPPTTPSSFIKSKHLVKLNFTSLRNSASRRKSTSKGKKTSTETSLPSLPKSHVIDVIEKEDEITSDPSECLPSPPDFVNFNLKSSSSGVEKKDSKLTEVRFMQAHQEAEISIASQAIRKSKKK
ncbi:hypothetical protein Aperf_G00000037543 [Anoplocephala perfoliata]